MHHFEYSFVTIAGPPEARHQSWAVGHADFQDVKQSNIFAACGVSFSMDVPCAEACLPLLRNAISTAWHQRTAAHVAIPCDFHDIEAPFLPKRLDMTLRGGDLFKVGSYCTFPCKIVSRCLSLSLNLLTKQMTLSNACTCAGCAYQD